MSRPRYPEYKASGIDWLEEVPVHWQSCKLKHLCSFTTGWTPPTGDSSAYEGSNLWANISDLGERIVSNTKKRISDEAVAKANICISPKGSLLFSFKLSVGQVSITGCDMYTNEAIATFKESDLLLTGYAYYALPVFVVRNASENIYGAKLLNQELINSAKVAVPPANEQRYLMAFLDRETAKIDALIAEQEKLLALLAEKRQATISHAVTRGLDPNAPMKDSGIPWLGEVPAHWEVTRLKFVAAVQTGVAKGKDTSGKHTITVPYLRVANVQDGYLALEDVSTIEIEPEQLDRYRLQSGDVLMNEGGDFDKLGRGALWSGEIDDCIHQNHVFAVRPHGVTPQWLNQVAGSSYAQFYFMGRAKQSTNLASISSTNIMELPILLPPQDEQVEILQLVADEFANVDALCAAGRHAIAVLKERRSALITAAVTGQISVRGAVEARVA